MKAELRLPENFIEYQPQEAIYSNFKAEIKEELRNAIYEKYFFARYAAWDFNGKVWWNDKIGYWCIEIWKFKYYVTTHISETLEELIDEVRKDHGDK